MYIKTSLGCSPAFTLPACPPVIGPDVALSAGGSNAPSFTDPALTANDVDGAGTGCILVYTDDCSGNNPLIAALSDMGLAYASYFQSPYSFESVVSANVYRLILVDHACYNDLSYIWDDLVSAYQGGACVGIASYDWDGSDDLSSAVSSFLALGGASQSHDILSQGTVNVWNPSPLFTGLSTSLIPTQDYYTDKGDAWLYSTAEAGWTASPQAGQGTAVIAPKLALLGFLPDELAPSDGKRLWKNVIDYLMTGGPTPVRTASWSAIKAMYR